MPAMSAWNVIKGPLLKAAPWIGCVLAILLAWHLVAVHYRSEGRAESTAIIASDEAAMKRATEVLNTTRGALNDQTVKIKAFSVKAEQASRESHAEHEAAVKRNASLLAENKRLTAAATRHYSSADPCSTPIEVLEGRGK
jgi:hypothetical protein